MTSSSFPSFSPNTQPKYDVYLSFSNEDTGNNFTSHLSDALCRENIKTFVDCQLKRGEEISQMVLKTIEESKISVIIFSKHYASSPHRLDELLHILECNRANGQRVIPIFYHVEPAIVRYQMGSFAEAFAKHEEDFKDRKDKVEGWRAALKKVANLVGWHDSHGRESELVDKIVRDILGKLIQRSSSVGMEERFSWRPCLASRRKDFWPPISSYAKS